LSWECRWGAHRIPCSGLHAGCRHVFGPCVPATHTPNLLAHTSTQPQPASHPSSSSLGATPHIAALTATPPPILLSARAPPAFSPSPRGRHSLIALLDPAVGHAAAERALAGGEGRAAEGGDARCGASKGHRQRRTPPQPRPPAPLAASTASSPGPVVRPVHVPAVRGAPVCSPRAAHPRRSSCRGRAAPGSSSWG
jgi:hypothetical protein